jgi:hypothetical protein
MHWSIRGFTFLLLLSLLLALHVYINLLDVDTVTFRSGFKFLRNKSYIPAVPIESVVMATSVNQTLGTTKDVSDNKVHIICADGQVGYLNDNYCDCSTGEDENSTSACSHIVPNRAIFTCVPFDPLKQKNSGSYVANFKKKKGHLRREAQRKTLVDKIPPGVLSIYGSRVHDGICDCFECADELLLL